MIIERPIDIEAEIQTALSPYVTIYAPPLPKTYTLPNLLVQMVGGDTSDHIDTIDVVIDSRAETASASLELLRNAIGILRKVCDEQTSALRYVFVNSLGSWGQDPVRPDLFMSSCRLRIVVHPEQAEIGE